MLMVPAEEVWIDAEHGRLFAKRWNPSRSGALDLAPIVLIHDSLGCVELWRGFPEQLARATGRTVIAYDRLGFGRSAAHPRTLTPRFVHEEAGSGFGALCAALQLDRFVVLGHSVGGAMAVACGAAYPTECQGIITEAAQAFVEELTLESIRKAGEAFAQPEQFARLAKYHGSNAGWVLRAWVDSWLAPEFRAWTLDDDLRHVKSPVLVLHGDGDEYGSVSQPRRIADLTEGLSTLCLLRDCGHVPHREKEAVVLSCIADWLGPLKGDLGSGGLG